LGDRKGMQLVNISRQQSPEILVWEFFGVPGLTGSDLQKIGGLN